jgi:acetyltransferase-like isoleucine patch superfamily enzyme
MFIMNKAFDTLWKVSNEFWRWIDYPYLCLLFSLNGITWGKDWRLYGIPVIQKHRQSIMRFGNGLSLRSSLRSNPLGPNHPVILCTWEAGAVLKIGANFAMTGGALCAAESITIGNHVNIGANSTIIDTDFHPIDPEDRRLHPQSAQTAPIVIEDNVFIGMNCIILKGVTIGQSSVVGAGSIVTKDVPARVIVAGNPARAIRAL